MRMGAIGTTCVPCHAGLLHLLLLVAATLVLNRPALAMDREVLTTLLHQNVHAMKLVNVQPMTEADMERTRVLCWVNTYHANHADRVLAIKQTWGTKCDTLLFMSDKEDDSIPTVRITAPPLHETVWPKHREVVRTLLREYSEGQFDWVFKCDDDTFVLMENLKAYLQSPAVQALPLDKPTLLGHRMTLPWWEIRRPLSPADEHDPEHVAIMKRIEASEGKHGGLYYTPGGGGYAMNWAYLKTLGESFDEPYCLPDELPMDDWAISFCMLHHNVTPVDTRDAQKRERFHQYNPVQLYFRPHNESDFNAKIHNSIYEGSNWFSDHNGIGWQNGDNCCAPDSITFHYIMPPLTERFYEYYYGADGLQEAAKSAS